MTNQYILSKIITHIAALVVIAICGFAVGGAIVFFGIVSAIDIRETVERRKRIDRTYLSVMTHGRRVDPEEDWLS